MSPDCNSFNAKYSKREAQNAKHSSTTGAFFFLGGFTLAEVLITLSIIGVVAALTIPSLIVNNQEKQTVVQLKKVYNVFSNAFSLAVIEYGSPETWAEGAVDAIGSSRTLDKLAPFLNLTRRCDGTKGCFPANISYKYYNSNNYQLIDNTKYAMGNFPDGTMFGIWIYNSSCNYKFGESEALKRGCSFIQVDTNGHKGPNQLGKDFFMFYITNSGIVPAGTSDETEYPVEKCREGGFGCAAWALLKENLNYPPLNQGWD